MADSPVGSFSVRRIVVALDSSPHSRAAFDAATALATRLGAELEGLFVEDIDLVNLAGLPIGREFDLKTGRAAPFDAAALEKQLRQEVARARRMVEAAASGMHLRACFRVTRGRLDAEIVSAAGEADLLIVGAAGLDIGFGMRFRPSRVALAAAEHAPRSVLLLRSGTTVEGHPLVPYDGSPGAEKALDAAISLAELNDKGIRILLTTQDREEADRLERQVTEKTRAAGLRPKVQRATGATLIDMCRIVHDTEADILVLSADDVRLAGEGRNTLLERVACPVLLVR